MTLKRPLTLKDKLMYAASFLWLAVILGGIIFYFGYPFTCEQAERSEKQAEKKLDEVFGKAENGSASDADIKSATYDKNKASSKALKKCRNR